MPHAIADVRDSLGAILIGGFISMVFSGVVGVQVYLYFRIYTKDPLRNKALVFFVWFLDVVHSTLITISLWKYFVLDYGDTTTSDYINVESAVTLSMTATMTFVVHMFFAHRVFKLSKNNWLVTAPITIIALIRLGAGIAASDQMATLKSYRIFVHTTGWILTVALTTATVVDILIAGAMCFFLQRSRTGFSATDHLIDTLLVYSLNNGALTCIITIITLVCWLVMNDNLIFFSIHFSITKLYAVSLLNTLNTRHSIRERSQQSDGFAHPLPVLFPHGSSQRTHSVMARFPSSQQNHELDAIEPGPTKVSVNVEQTIHYDVGELTGSSPNSDYDSDPKSSGPFITSRR